MTDNGIVPVMPMGNDGGFGGNNFTSIFGLLILLGLFTGGFNGNGWGGNNTNLDQDINRGFDNQNLQAQTRDILAAVTDGTAQSIAATNQTFHDILGVVSDKYNEITRDISDVRVAQAQSLANQNECCCATKQMILEKSAATDAAIAASKYETAMQMAQMEARLTAKMDANEIQNLRDQVSQLQLAQATSGMLKFPNSWSYGAGPFPPIFGNCGCCQ